MFPFVFLTLPLSLPFTWQIVACFRQEQPAAGSHKGNQGGWGQRMGTTRGQDKFLHYPPPSTLRLQHLHPSAPGKLDLSILIGESGPHTLLIQSTSCCPILPRMKRRGSMRHGPMAKVARRTKGLGMQEGCCCSSRVCEIPVKPLPCSQSRARWLVPSPSSAQTSHVVSSHATNTSKTSSPASVMEAIKISDSTDNRQGHQLKGMLLSDNRGFIDLKKKKRKRNLYFFFIFLSSSANFFADLLQTRGS